MIRSFTDLEIWQLAQLLIVKIYKLLGTFPNEEKFGIVSQCKDSVVSIAANIAEGFGRFHYKDKIKFYYNSRGSLFETKSHVLISNSLGYITGSSRQLFEEILKDIDQLGVKINNFISSVNRSTT